MQTTVPHWLQGVWQRTRIVFANGEQDTTSRVYWLQGLSCYGDLRIAASRPEVSAFGASSRADQALAHQQGATGHCHCPTQQATWHREWGYQPIVDFPEPGDLTPHGDVVIERAPSGAYEEEWHRLTPPDPSIHVWRREDDTARLLVIDAHAMLIVRRTDTLPSHPLPALLDTDPAAASRLLDCEISYALRPQADAEFVVKLSTLPWREGQPLMLCDPQGEIREAGWRLEERHLGAGEEKGAVSGHDPYGHGTRFAG